jgi:hypothetical protein
MDTILSDIQKANKKVIGHYRYKCGIAPSDIANTLKDSKARFFFESPDGQNYEFYMALMDLGYKEKFFKAPYYWEIEKDGFSVNYVEGDLYITKN